MNKSKIVTLAMISALLLMMTASAVNAQGDATVVVLDSVGGTVDPAGANTYPSGTAVTLTASPTDSGYVFDSWIISSEDGDTVSFDNPLTLTVTGGATYAIQAVFAPVQAPPGGNLPTDMGTAAIVVVLTSAGGTTSPAPGTYALADAEQLMLTATADSGYQFSHWTISGFDTGHGDAPTNWTPTDNPYNVNHGYGATYNYQAVFVQAGGATPTPPGSTPTPPPGMGGLTNDQWIIIGLVVVIVVVLIAFGVFAMRKK